MSFLLHNLIHFTRMLHRLGLDVQAGRTRDVAMALRYVDVGQRSEFYHCLRCLLIHRVDDLPLFDEAFRVFWRRPHGDWTESDLRAMGEKRRSGQPEYESELPPDASPGGDGAAEAPPRYQVERMAALSYSDRDGLWAKDFEQFTEAEVAEAERMMATLDWELGERRSQRWMPGKGPALDLRRAVRRNMRHGGEIVHLPSRRRKTKRRPLILLCDVSGSMERYSRMLLHFVHTLSGGGRLGRVESFVFATRLTRITHQLTARRPATAVVPSLPRTIGDFGGGTRIGDSLHTFNTEWARRVRGQGPVVLLISDGWDRGEPGRLRTEMARLHRSCHRLIWLNPLLGSPDYLPLTRGMQAALPEIDDFLPVHNLASLESLARHLNSLPAHRPPPRRAASRPGQHQVNA
ncbi:MAG: VWA domain-containing protein [Acidobacteria bacterium]|nr:VWA domain-containing protein [Acidobacteriota bacterium]MYJ05703.1 VWA domain-containing protein [Acidobacteriota bacterium]